MTINEVQKICDKGELCKVDYGTSSVVGVPPLDCLVVEVFEQYPYMGHMQPCALILADREGVQEEMVPLFWLE